MNLENFLKNIKRNSSLALLFFQDDDLVCNTYETKGSIPKCFLKKRSYGNKTRRRLLGGVD